MWNQMWYCWVLVSKHVRRRALGVRPWRLVLTDVVFFLGGILWEPKPTFPSIFRGYFCPYLGGCETIIAVSSWYCIWNLVMSCCLPVEQILYCCTALFCTMDWWKLTCVASSRKHPLLVKCYLFCTHSYKVGGKGIQIHTIYSSWRFKPFYFHPYVKKIAILTCAYYWHMNCCNIYILTLLWFRGPPISTPTSRT